MGTTTDQLAQLFIGIYIIHIVHLRLGDSPVSLALRHAGVLADEA